jgi:hypothetical protein
LGAQVHGHKRKGTRRLRDIESHPYSDDEKRVAKYIVEMTNNTAGAGDDPIGFLIASHAYSRQQIQTQREFTKELMEICERYIEWAKEN